MLNYLNDNFVKRDSSNIQNGANFHKKNITKSKITFPFMDFIAKFKNKKKRTKNDLVMKSVLKTLRNNRHTFSINDLENVNNFINSCLKDKISNV